MRVCQKVYRSLLLSSIARRRQLLVVAMASLFPCVLIFLFLCNQNKCSITKASFFPTLKQALETLSSDPSVEHPLEPVCRDGGRRDRRPTAGDAGKSRKQLFRLEEEPGFAGKALPASVLGRIFARIQVQTYSQVRLTTNPHVLISRVRRACLSPGMTSSPEKMYLQIPYFTGSTHRMGQEFLSE